MAEAHRIPAGGRATGAVTVPPSKSVTHRVLNLALLAGQPVAITRPLWAQDTQLFFAALGALGWRVEPDGETFHLTPPPRELPPREVALFAGNAGTLFRFLTASLTTVAGVTSVLDGTARLRERPVGPLVTALRGLGAVIDDLGAPGHAPLRLHGGSFAGGQTELDAGESSQYLSALMMAGLVAPRPTAIGVTALTSEPYVAITRAAIRRFAPGPDPVAEVPGGFRVTPAALGLAAVTVDGDYSAAAYPAAMAALTGGPVELAGLDPESPQGDRAFLDLLAAMGARLRWQGGRLVVTGPDAGPLTAIRADLSATPDQVPTLAALAPFARGTTEINNVPHLRIKESDRLAAMAEGLLRAGVPVVERPDGLSIPGVWADQVPPADPVEVATHGDHRIAMAFALVGLRRPNLVVQNPEVVAKSYPEFWRDFVRLLAP